VLCEAIGRMPTSSGAGGACAWGGEGLKLRGSASLARAGLGQGCLTWHCLLKGGRGPVGGAGLGCFFNVSSSSGSKQWRQPLASLLGLIQDSIRLGSLVTSSTALEQSAGACWHKVVPAC